VNCPTLGSALTQTLYARQVAAQASAMDRREAELVAVAMAKEEEVEAGERERAVSAEMWQSQVRSGRETTHPLPGP
jgi:hypothetical protein